MIDKRKIERSDGKKKRKRKIALVNLLGNLVKLHIFQIKKSLTHDLKKDHGRENS